MRRLVIVLFAVVLLVSGANVALALSKPDQERPRTLTGPGGAAVTAAVHGVPLALGYDHRTLDAGLRRATAVMTPAFADDFRATFRRTVAPRAERREEVADAVVRDAGLVRIVVDDLAVVLVFADQRLLATDGNDLAEPRVTRRVRLKVSLERVDGEWLVSRITLL